MFDINNCTVQEAVEYAVEKIVAQGGMCMSDDDIMCLYSIKGVDNIHCAVGWLLDHSKCDFSDYKGDLMSLIGNGYPVPEIVKNNSFTFSLLQSFHDMDYKHRRLQVIQSLKRKGIDTSNPAFEVWVNMGE